MPLVCGVIGLGHGSVVRHSLAFVRSHAVVIVEGNGIAGGHVHPHVVGELAGLAIGGLGRIDAAVLVDLGVALDRVAGIHGHGGLLGPLLQLGVVDLLTVLAGDRAGVVAGSVGLEHGLAVQIQLADDGVCGERILQLGLLSAVGQDRLQSAAVRGLRQGGRAAVRQGHVGLDIGLVGHGPVTGHIDAIALLNQGDVAVPLRVLVLQRHHSAGDGGVVGVLQGHRDPVAQVDSGAFLVSGGLPVLGSIGCEGDAFEVAGNFDNLIGVDPGAVTVLDRFPNPLHSVAGLSQGHVSTGLGGRHYNLKGVAQEVGCGSGGLGLDGDGQIPAGLSAAVFAHSIERHRDTVGYRPAALSGVIPGQGDGFAALGASGELVLHIGAFRAAVSLDIGTALHGDGAGFSAGCPVVTITARDQSKGRRLMTGIRICACDSNSIRQERLEIIVGGLHGLLCRGDNHADRPCNLPGGVDVRTISFKRKAGHRLAVFGHAGDLIALGRRESHGLGIFTMFDVLAAVVHCAVVDGAHYGVGDLRDLTGGIDLHDHVCAGTSDSFELQFIYRNCLSKRLAVNRSGQRDAGDVLHRNTVVLAALTQGTGPDVVNIVIGIVLSPAIAEVVGIGTTFTSIYLDGLDGYIGCTGGISARYLLQDGLLEAAIPVHYMVGGGSAGGDLDAVDGHIAGYYGSGIKEVTCAVLAGVPAHKVLGTHRGVVRHLFAECCSGSNRPVSIIIPEGTADRSIAEGYRVHLRRVRQTQGVIAIPNLIRAGPGERIPRDGDRSLLSFQFNAQVVDVCRPSSHGRKMAECAGSKLCRIELRDIAIIKVDGDTIDFCICVLPRADQHSGQVGALNTVVKHRATANKLAVLHSKRGNRQQGEDHT